MKFDMRMVFVTLKIPVQGKNRNIGMAGRCADEKINGGTLDAVPTAFIRHFSRRLIMRLREFDILKSP